MIVRGYRILDMRYKTPVGEIDIVAKRGRRIAFIEVKRRASLDDALASVTPRLQDRVARAAALWLRRHAPEYTQTAAFDVIALVPVSRVPLLRPHYVKDAFEHRRS